VQPVGKIQRNIREAVGFNYRKAVAHEHTDHGSAALRAQIEGKMIRCSPALSITACRTFACSVEHI
jgi:hypothetical protein